MAPSKPPLPIPPPQGGREEAAVSDEAPSIVVRMASRGDKPLRGRRRWKRWIAGAAIAASLLALATGGAGFIVIRDIKASLPSPPDPAKVETSTVVLDRNGRLLRPFTTADGRWRLPVAKGDVDPRFLEMLIGYEDRRFAEHHGVDYRALVRAAGQFLLAGGHIVSGGSTLSMQVARLIEGEPTRDAASKLRQILAARALEAHLSKDQILDLYLTLAPYGGNIEGVRAASLAYFGKEPRRLTVAEAALLVVLPQSPEARRPDRDVTAARAARDRVLDRLAAEGVIDRDAAEAAKSEGMPDARRPFPMLAAHLAYEAVAARQGDVSRSSIAPSPALPGKGDWRPAEIAASPMPLKAAGALPRTTPTGQVIKLTVDRDLQASLEALAAERAGILGPKLSVAIVVADEMSGAILASVGSAGLFEDERDGHVDMTRALRSPGSTLKPLIYGLAFEQGLAHPESLIEDRPTGFGAYAPQNFDGFHRGTVTMREALTQSLNVPAIVVLDAVGPARLVARMKRAAIAPVLPDQSAPGLAIGLGGVGVTLRDLVQLYAAIARGGTAVTLRDGVNDQPIAPLSEAGAPVLSPVAAWYVADILSGTPPPVTGSPGRVAFKTGTSYGYRDAWAIGFDGKNVIGVWIGRPDGTPVPGLSGIVSAAPILFEAFDRLGEKRAPLRPPPPGVLVASTAQLPIPLRRFRHPNEAIVARDGEPEIAYPLDGVEVDLGIKEGDPAPLVIKVRNGEPPFTFFANGVPIARTPFDRSESWQPEGPGYVTLSVVDSSGRSDRVTVFVE
jgi:penicillin-binding protein 1C